jgi:hypothetical protein
MVMIQLTLDTKLATRKGNRLNYIFYLNKSKTFGELMMIIRKKIYNIQAGESIFVLYKNKMVPMHFCVGAYGEPILKCDLMLESAFGTLDRMYLRSEIRELENHYWLATIWYSWYGISDYRESKYCPTKDKAERWILEQRTNGKMVEKKNETEKG